MNLHRDTRKELGDNRIGPVVELGELRGAMDAVRLEDTAQLIDSLLNLAAARTAKSDHQLCQQLSDGRARLVLADIFRQIIHRRDVDRLGK